MHERFSVLPSKYTVQVFPLLLASGALQGRRKTKKRIFWTSNEKPSVPLSPPHHSPYKNLVSQLAVRVLSVSGPCSLCRATSEAHCKTYKGARRRLIHLISAPYPLQRTKLKDGCYGFRDEPSGRGAPLLPSWQGCCPWRACRGHEAHRPSPGRCPRARFRGSCRPPG